MDWNAVPGTLITGSLVASVVTLVSNRWLEHRKKKQLAVARLRSMLLDLTRIEELATEYRRPKAPKAPAYRMPTTLLEGCILWFAEGSRLSGEQLRPLHRLLSDAQEINRCLDLAHEARMAYEELRSEKTTQLVKGEIERTELKCKNALASAAASRDVAKAVLAALGHTAQLPPPPNQGEQSK